MYQVDEQVCKCKYVSEETVQKSIDKGADTVDKIGLATGAGRGACKGARCKQKLFEMIKKSK